MKQWFAGISLQFEFRYVQVSYYALYLNKYCLNQVSYLFISLFISHKVIFGFMKQWFAGISLHKCIS